MSSVAMVVGVLAILVVVAAAIKTVLWVGEDARRRGLQRVWLLQLLCVMQFPWPFLMYYMVTRELDDRGTPQKHDVAESAHIGAASWG